MPNNVVQEYERVIKKANGKILLESLYNLFTTDFTHEIHKLCGNEVMIVSSTTEDLYLRKQSEHIRRCMKNEQTLFIEGSHEDFILKPNHEVVKKVVEFLTQ